jgi:hypothetical protein
MHLNKKLFQKNMNQVGFIWSRVWTSVGRFSNPNPVLNSVLKSVLTVRIGWLWELDGEWTSDSLMNKKRLWEPVHIYREPDMFSHRTQIRFSEFSWIIYWFLLFFSLGTATLLPVAITFFSSLLFFSCCCYFSHIVLLFSCDEVINY